MTKQRTCVICKMKKDKKYLFRFNVMNVVCQNEENMNEQKILQKEIVIDLNHRLTGRGFYCCSDNLDCEKHIPKWVNKKKALRFIEMSDK